MAEEKPMLPGEIPWPEETMKWYEAWRSSPRTDEWDEAQWQYMYDTALVHSAVWGSQDFGMVGELRARLSYMGLNFEPPPKSEKKREETTLNVIKFKREERVAKAANKA